MLFALPGHARDTTDDSSAATTGFEAVEQAIDDVAVHV